ncbi:MAG TPA: UPF0158 family protein [Abditibacteriaceae bacterium]|nr:UPF0158 family protein [Abditibacteriaceae bacterium]
MMAIPVSLRDVVDEMSIVGDEHTAYVNRRTGELVTLSHEELSAAEEDAPLEDYPEWQREMIEKAGEVLDSEDYLALPGKFDIHEYRIMEEFCDAVEEAQTRDDLLYRIRGKGAFRRFKDAIHALGIEQQWYSFRDAEVARIVMDWLEAHAIPYTRDLNPPGEST